MSKIDLDPTVAFQALQTFVAQEIARLYGEIAARDAYITQLQSAASDDTDE